MLPSPVISRVKSSVKQISFSIIRSSMLKKNFKVIPNYLKVLTKNSNCTKCFTKHMSIYPCSSLQMRVTTASFIKVSIKVMPPCIYRIIFSYNDSNIKSVDMLKYLMVKLNTNQHMTILVVVVYFTKIHTIYNQDVEMILQYIY